MLDLLEVFICFNCHYLFYNMHLNITLIIMFENFLFQIMLK